MGDRDRSQRPTRLNQWNILCHPVNPLLEVYGERPIVPTGVTERGG